MVDKTTMIKAGSAGSSILPAIAIIGVGYLGYRALSGSNFGGIPGGIAGGIAGGITERIESFTTNIKNGTKSVFTASENSTEADVFTKSDGIPEKHNGKTYSQWVAELPPAQRAAVAAGNMLTGNAAAEYGAYVRDKTLSSISKTTGRDELSIRRLYNQKSPVNKSLIALGQAVTVPFIDGGAANLGAKVGMKKQEIKTGVSNWVSTGVTSGKPEASGVSIAGTVKSAASGAVKSGTDKLKKFQSKYKK